MKKINEVLTPIKLVAPMGYDPDAAPPKNIVSVTLCCNYYLSIIQI